MDSWITIILTLLLLIVPTIVKAKKAKAENASGSPSPRSFNFPGFDDEEPLMDEDGQDEEIAEEKVYHPSSERVPEVSIQDNIPEPEMSFPADVYIEGGTDRIPTINTDSFKVEDTDGNENKEKIDVQKLIIYSEIMKPKFQDF